jgi:hypothetical protein
MLICLSLRRISIGRIRRIGLSGFMGFIGLIRTDVSDFSKHSFSAFSRFGSLVMRRISFPSADEPRAVFSLHAQDQIFLERKKRRSLRPFPGVESSRLALLLTFAAAASSRVSILSSKRQYGLTCSQISGATNKSSSSTTISWAFTSNKRRSKSTAATALLQRN